MALPRKVSQTCETDIVMALREGSAWLVVQALIDEKTRRYEFDEGWDVLLRVRARLD